MHEQKKLSQEQRENLRKAVKTPIMFQSRDIYGNKFAATQKKNAIISFHSFFRACRCSRLATFNFFLHN
jgi:hypothetical protein